jgi:hypothetical protein
VVKGMLVPHEMNEDGKCSKNRLYGPILVLREKIAVGEEFTEIICV